MDQNSEAKTEEKGGLGQAGRYEQRLAAAAEKLRREADLGDRRTVKIDGANGAWLVVLTKAGREQYVHDQLVHLGFEVFLPLQPVCQRTFLRRGVVTTPFFPRMLFARATLDAQRWQQIFSVIGVQRVMCDPMNPKGVTDAFVERLRARIFDEFMAIGLVDSSRPSSAPKAKDRRQWVKLTDVLDGIMAEGVAERRESVLLSLLNEGHAALTQSLRRK